MFDLCGMDPAENKDMSNSDQAASNIFLFELKKPVIKKEEEIAHYVCYVCKKTFYNANALQNHKKLQHGSNNAGLEDKVLFKSEQILNSPCDFKFIPLTKSGEGIKVEEDGVTKRTFTEATSYLIVKYESSCNCRAKKLRQGSMMKKMQTKTEKKPVDLRGPFTCTLPSNVNIGLQCRQVFFNCCDYSHHYREEHTKRRKAALRCQVCEKSLNKYPYPANGANQHLEAQKVTFPCLACGLSFFDSSQYDEHKRIVHAKMKPHQCSICFKRFTQVGGLHQHMRMHSGIRPFVCRFCCKAFTQKAGLDQHLRTHTKIKPFKCIICSKCFSQSVHLRQHMRTHTNIQPFGCPVCKKRFKQSSHLNFHMRSHMDEASALLVQQYNQAVQQQARGMDFLSLANVQPVQDGDTLYYEAQLTQGLEPASTPYFLQGPLPSNNTFQGVSAE